MPEKVTKPTAILTRDRIMESDDRNTKEIDVPEWGGKVLIRELSAQDRGKLESEWTTDTANIARTRLMLVAMSVVSEARVPLFTQDELELLGERAYEPINRIFMAALDFNGMTKKPGDDKAGDFTVTTGDDSSSG